MIDYITATKIITAEFKGMYIDLAPEGFPMEEDEFNELMTKLKFTFGDNDVLILPSNFGFDGENFRATFTDVGVTLFDGPGTIQDGNTSIFNVSAENLKPFVDWLNANMEAAK